MELQFCSIYLFIWLLHHFHIPLLWQQKTDRKAALEASPLVSVVNAFKQQLMNPWRYSKRVLEHVLEQTVDLIFFMVTAGYSRLLFPNWAEWDYNGKKKSERALKRFLFVFGDLLPLCSLQWHLLPCAFLRTYVDFFNNRCGVTFLVWVSSCKKRPISAEWLHTHIHTHIHTNRAKREIKLCVDLQTVVCV